MNNVFTHKGWFFLCPVWVNPKTCQLVARFRILEWWLSFNEFLILAFAWLLLKFKKSGHLVIDPVWQVRKLKQPKMIDVR